MKVRFFDIIYIFILLSLVLYALCFRDLKGVFFTDKNFRTETKYIVIHHDDICRDNSIKEIDDFHKEERGWEVGFAYHYYVKDGKINQLHNPDAVLPHALACNYNAVAICIHTADKHKLLEQIELIILVKYLMFKYNITKENVKGHCEVNSCTKCPLIDMNELRKWL